MSAVLDIILILIVVVFALIGAKKGFFKSVSGFASYVVGMIIATIFYQPFMAIVKRLPFFANRITDVEMPNLAEGEDMMEKLKIIMNYIIDNEDIGEKAEAIMNNLIVDVGATLISFGLLFIASSLIIKLVFLLLDFTAKMPVIKQINGMLGAVVGAITGIFWSWLFSVVFGGVIFPILNANYPQIFMDEMLESFVFKLCSEFNLIAFISALLHKIL